MRKLLIIVLLILGCGDVSLAPFPYEPMSECPDSNAMNYNFLDCCSNCIRDCPWETNEDCEYCEDLYETEEERWENCCNVSGADNYTGKWGDDNWSSDSTYCIMDGDTLNTNP